MISFKIHLKYFILNFELEIGICDIWHWGDGRLDHVLGQARQWGRQVAFTLFVGRVSTDLLEQPAAQVIAKLPGRQLTTRILTSQSVLGSVVRCTELHVYFQIQFNCFTFFQRLDLNLCDFLVSALPEMDLIFMKLSLSLHPLHSPTKTLSIIFCN